MEVDEDISTNTNTNKVISSRVYEWPSSSSSRIVRVSRGSGGKDRHSKVLTSKGLRDRRVRLSVTTAIQFYDLQDRLGYDQPSKAVEWLIKAAANSIAELPSLDPSSFVNFNNNVADSAINNNNNNNNNTVSNTVVDNNNNNNNNNNYDLLLSRSNSSSASENSKSGSGLSLSRSENRIRARERARGLAAAKKENEKSCSFTDLLSGGGIRNVTSNTTTPMDYFQQFENNNNCGQQHHEQQHFSFLQENNVTTSSGYNNIRGTLQSNLMSNNNNLHNLQRFHQPMVDNGGSSSPNFPFFVGPTMGGTSQFVVDGLDDSQRLRLYGGDDGGHYYDNHKDKSKS